jgi:hypothetical protein
VSQQIIDQIFTRPELRERPPVLVDIGASGFVHAAWRSFARYSVCLAFDADEREMGYVEKETATFRKLYVFNSLISDEGREDSARPFYLTRSPYCSSLLRPREGELESKWIFADLFAVEREVRLRTRTLASVLREVGLDRIDWFKTDSQGIDLRIFASLGESATRNVLAAEFEPGIIGAYHGEDKLWPLMAHMDKLPFWMADMQLHGTQRIRKVTVDARFDSYVAQRLPRLLRTSPGWAEVLYLNDFVEGNSFTTREYLLGWVFAYVQEQFGFALELAERASTRFGDRFFDLLAEEAAAGITRSLYNLPIARIRSLLLRLLAKLERHG